jgi:hypothetical protein
MEHKSIFNDEIALFKEKDTEEFTQFFGMELSTLLGVESFFVDELDKHFETAETISAKDSIKIIFDKIKTISDNDDLDRIYKIFAFELLGKVIRGVEEINEEQDGSDKEEGITRVIN